MSKKKKLVVPLRLHWTARVSIIFLCSELLITVGRGAYNNNRTQEVTYHKKTGISILKGLGKYYRCLKCLRLLTTIIGRKEYISRIGVSNYPVIVVLLWLILAASKFACCLPILLPILSKKIVYFQLKNRWAALTTPIILRVVSSSMNRLIEMFSPFWGVS